MPARDPATLLRDTRKAAGLTQGKASLLCGTTPTTWNRWEAGTRNIAPALLLGCLVLLVVDPRLAAPAARDLIRETEAERKARMWRRLKSRREDEREA